eukprot:TRINITY_DN10300_c1_g1_i1.p1 TRINITY_DN10300_c1_g1~~TRINITY_DN10300_c1_g1_i1.p1  ORF type:complete len:947 (+),score=314.44 TRINITY_DN10300_c1_g1_i1:73-2913(+)
MPTESAASVAPTVSALSGPAPALVVTPPPPPPPPPLPPPPPPAGSDADSGSGRAASVMLQPPSPPSPPQNRRSAQPDQPPADVQPLSSSLVQQQQLEATVPSPSGLVMSSESGSPASPALSAPRARDSPPPPPPEPPRLGGASIRAARAVLSLSAEENVGAAPAASPPDAALSRSSDPEPVLSPLGGAAQDAAKRDSRLVAENGRLRGACDGALGLCNTLCETATAAALRLTDPEVAKNVSKLCTDLRAALAAATSHRPAREAIARVRDAQAAPAGTSAPHPHTVIERGGGWLTSFSRGPLPVTDFVPIEGRNCDTEAFQGGLWVLGRGRGGVGRAQFRSRYCVADSRGVCFWADHRAWSRGDYGGQKRWLHWKDCRAFVPCFSADPTLPGAEHHRHALGLSDGNRWRYFGFRLGRGEESLLLATASVVDYQAWTEFIMRQFNPRQFHVCFPAARRDAACQFNFGDPEEAEDEVGAGASTTSIAVVPISAPPSRRRRQRRAEVAAACAKERDSMCVDETDARKLVEDEATAAVIEIGIGYVTSRLAGTVFAPPSAPAASRRPSGAATEGHGSVKPQRLGSCESMPEPRVAESVAVESQFGQPRDKAEPDAAREGDGDAASAAETEIARLGSALQEKEEELARLRSRALTEVPPAPDETLRRRAAREAAAASQVEEIERLRRELSDARSSAVAPPDAHCQELERELERLRSVGSAAEVEGLRTALREERARVTSLRGAESRLREVEAQLDTEREHCRELRARLEDTGVSRKLDFEERLQRCFDADETSSDGSESTEVTMAPVHVRQATPAAEMLHLLCLKLFIRPSGQYHTNLWTDGCTVRLLSSFDDLAPLQVDGDPPVSAAVNRTWRFQGQQDGTQVLLSLVVVPSGARTPPMLRSKSQSSAASRRQDRPLLSPRRRQNQLQRRAAPAGAASTPRRSSLRYPQVF